MVMDASPMDSRCKPDSPRIVGWREVVLIQCALRVNYSSRSSLAGFVARFGHAACGLLPFQPELSRLCHHNLRYPAIFDDPVTAPSRRSQTGAPLPPRSPGRADDRSAAEVVASASPKYQPHARQLATIEITANNLARPSPYAFSNQRIKQSHFRPEMNLTPVDSSPDRERSDLTKLARPKNADIG
jgi:hypothetical protein